MAAAFSPDGKEWRGEAGSLECKLPRKLKVGVFAESTAPGKFRVRFDRFSLSPPTK